MGEPDPNGSLELLRRIARLRVSLGFVVAAGALWFATPGWRSLLLGAAVAICGEGLRVWAAGHIRKSREVTASGPYRFTRHPLYLGSFIMGLGFAVAADSLPVATAVVAYLVIMFGVAIRLEEATLRRTFGDEYDRYADGHSPHADRSFNLSLAVENGEGRTVLGFLGVIGILALKTWLSASASGI